MKSFNLLFIVLVLLTACAPDAPPPSTTYQEEIDPQDELIEALNQKKLAIDRLLASAELRHDSLAFECERTREGGRLSFFKEGEEVRLLRYAYYNGDHHGGTISVYVEKEQLFYAQVEESTWSFDEEALQDDGTPHTREDYTHYTYYYDSTGQEGVRCLQKDYVVRSVVALPTEVEKIKTNEISCTGARKIRAFFSQVQRVKRVGELLEILCADG